MEVEIRVDNFEKEVLQSKKVILVDFWAPWCGPCQMVAPYIDELAKEYDGKLKVCKVNIDEASAVASKYSVMSIPTFMIFKEGRVREKRAGVMSKKDLQKLVRAYL